MRRELPKLESPSWQNMLYTTEEASMPPSQFQVSTQIPKCPVATSPSPSLPLCHSLLPRVSCDRFDVHYMSPPGSGYSDPPKMGKEKIATIRKTVMEEELIEK